MPGKVEIVAEEKHSGDVTSIIYHNGHVYTAGGDGKLKVTVEFGKFVKLILFLVDFQ
jgi:hypothetical protein